MQYGQWLGTSRDHRCFAQRCREPFGGIAVGDRVPHISEADACHEYHHVKIAGEQLFCPRKQVCVLFIGLLADRGRDEGIAVHFADEHIYLFRAARFQRQYPVSGK